MHTARSLAVENFSIEIEGRQVQREALFAGQAHERFGIVVTSPLGALGASLLIDGTSGLGDPLTGGRLTLIGEAVFARCLSAQKEERVSAAAVLRGPSDVYLFDARLGLDRKSVV